MYKYEQIAKIIEKQIINQKYKQGERLPSIHQLSKQYHCSKATIIKCYETLEKKHLIYVKKQSGYYVADNYFKTEQFCDGYELNTGNPIVSATSLIDAKHYLSIAIDQYSESSLNMSLEGVQSLRSILPAFLEQFAIYTKVDNVYLIQGITQMLSFFSTAQFPNHKKTILIEEPTYSYFVDFLHLINIPVLTIKRDEKGIDIKHLEYLFKEQDIRFFYTIPRNHNPLGTVLDNYTCKEIARLALKYDVYIIEDDYFGHCSFTPRFLPIFYYMGGKNCIYLTSFSKTIPYIRIGICVIDDALQEVFDKLMQQSYYFSYQLPSLISQATFESYLKSSLYQKQTQSIKNLLQKNYQIIKNITKSWDQNIIQVISDYSGYYFSALINDKIDIIKLQSELLKRNIKIKDAKKHFYHLDTDLHMIRFSLARIQPKQLKEAMLIFYQILIEQSQFFE